MNHANADGSVDYRHWGIHLGRTFRALKLWFVLRTYGLCGLQAFIRNHIRLAKRFEELVRQDKRFEICNNVEVSLDSRTVYCSFLIIFFVQMGLVCFRVVGSNQLNENIFDRINTTGKLFLNMISRNDQHIIRFCVHVEKASDEDIGNF